MTSAALLPEPAAPTDQATILVVDDSPNQLVAIQALLAPLGQRVVTASSGGDALRLLLEMDCAVVLLDVHLLDIDGFEVARFMRERERTCRTPIIFISGLTADAHFTTRGYSMGAVDFLFKPFDPRVLRAKVEVFVELYLHRERLKLQAEREKAESERLRLLSLLTQTPAAIAITRGTDFVFEFANPLYQKVVGRSVPLGRPLREVMPEVVSQPGVMEALRQAMRTGEPFVGREMLIVLDRHGNGVLEEAFFDLVYQPLRDEQGEVEWLLTHAVEVTEQVRARRKLEEREHALRESEGRFRLMAEAGELLSSLEDRTVLQRLAELVVPRLADWAAVDLLSETGAVERVAAVHSEPEKAELAFEIARRWPIDRTSHGGIGQVLRTGEPLLIEHMSDELLPRLVRSEDHLRLARTLGFKSSLCLPLVARGRVLGALSLVHAESGRRFSEKDLPLAQELARRAGLAVDNALLYREAREAQGRASRLQAVAAALSRAATPAEVARAILTEGLQQVGTHAGLVYWREPEGSLRVLHDVGYSKELVRRVRHLSAEDRMPQLDAVRTGEARWFSSTEELLADYPQMAAVLSSFQARVALPLRVEGNSLGCLWLSFQDKRPFSPEERNFLTALAQLCSQALERARLLAVAREQAEHMRLLADAVKTFSEAGGDVEASARALVRRVSESFGDACALLLGDEVSGGVTFSAMYHPDPWARALLQETIRGTYEREEGPALRVLRTGQPLRVSRVRQEGLLESLEPQVRPFVECFGLHGVLIVPLRAQGQILGTLGVFRSRPDLPFTPEEQALLQELADRAGLVVSNARLLARANSAR
ncbi:GAF domain-containing protein [Archangium minus]|uniref:GAF domain-containing protein n=1 Tax=Archangium minus TaxID=83450 RepID=A0ABY9WQ65_9BACT|nr:GAF domain-containing protein [Archangium minus]